MMDIYIGRYEDYLVLVFPVQDHMKGFPFDREQNYEKIFLNKGDFDKTLADSAKWLKEKGLEEPKFLELRDEQSEISPLNEEQMRMFQEIYGKDK